LNRLTLEHVIKEAAAWGLDPDDARATTVAVLEAVAGAATATPAQDVISFLKQLVPARAEDLLNGRTARRALDNQASAIT
jgi:serine/threonine-protein kinase HipA